MEIGSQETAKELFSFLDTQQKGYVVLDEISRLVDVNEEFTPSQLNSIFSFLDKHGEAKITLQGFIEAFVTSRDADLLLQNRGESTGANADEIVDNTCLDQPDYLTKETQSPPTLTIGIPSTRLARPDGFHTPLIRRVDYDHVSDVKGNSFLPASDDVFEGDGLLTLDSPTLSASPSRSTLQRSPSLRKRTSRPQLTPKNSGEYDDLIRLPPDGGEGSSNRSSPKRSRRTHPQKIKPNNGLDEHSRGFAKEAINDLLKIVDTHTLSSLGVYGHQKDGVWRHDINWNVPDEPSNSDMPNERTCPPWLRASMDWTYDDVSTRPDSRENKWNSDIDENDVESGTTPSNSSHSLNSLHNCDIENLEQPPDEEAEIEPMCNPSDSSHKHSAFSPSCISGAPDSYADFDSPKPKTRDRNETASVDGGNKMQVGATVDRNVVGNLIFDMGDQNHVGLYDRILNYSGVELNSRLSSSETSLHELLIEAEAVRNNAAHMEDFDSVLKRINGMALFGG